MSYFTEVSDFQSYANDKADFHFSYNANSGGGQSFLGGQFYNEEGVLTSPTDLDGKIGVFKILLNSENGDEISLLLNDVKGQYEIKPRGEGSNSMKLGVGDNVAPSKLISSIFMLPPTCTIKSPSNLDVSILTSNNFWLQSMWLKCSKNESAENMVDLIPKDFIYCGGSNKDGKGTKRYFKLEAERRVRDILFLSNNTERISEDLRHYITVFASIYSGMSAFDYDSCIQATNQIMVFLAKKYPDKYFGIEDPLPFLMSLQLSSTKTQIDTFPQQIIFYGAPGTGKSFAIEEQTEGEDVIRTTFHPDSDYSTFVGAYKPTTKEVPVISNFGGKAIKVKDEDGNEIKEERIVYEFVNQAFLHAYIGAWEKFAGAAGQRPQKQFLVIEEINRGNCAQIFGDLFQLLDRNPQGFSEYPIKADADMKKQLKKQLAGLTIENADAINALYKNEDVVSKVLDGDILLLPSNLFIWATMNTSDQSLFPIDSAFKRRWDWKYVPIANAGKDWKIQVYGKDYDWWDFLEKVNALIGDTTNSEDKKLGYFFCKPTDGVITPETFVSKVIFYLWNDVFKDFEFDGDAFIDEDNQTKLTFDKFYNPNTTVREKTVDVFLTNLGVSFAYEVKDDFDDDDLEDDNENNSFAVGGTYLSKGRDYSKFSINGIGSFNKRQVPAECVKTFIQMHSEMSSADVIDTWQALGIKKYFVEESEQHEERRQSSNDPNFDSRSYPVELSNGDIIFVDNQFGLARIESFIEKVNAQNWGIHIEKL